MSERLGYEPTPPEEPKKFWYGKDFITTKAIEIDGLTKVSVLPQINGSLPPDQDIRNLSVATRSRFAQWGLEVLQKGVGEIADNEERAQTRFYRMPAEVAVKNHARKLHIPAGVPLFSLYSKGSAIVGEELASMMGTEIEIDGVQGKNWKYIYKNPDSKRKDEITGIAVQIRNEHRWYIPDSDDPLNTAELAFAGNYRQVLDQEYAPVPRLSPVDIWFGELPNLKLSQRVAVELAKSVAPNLNVSANIEEMERQRIYPNGRHIGARLLHPGSGLNNPEGWPIRVEIDTRGSVQKPGAVIFRVMRAA